MGCDIHVIMEKRGEFDFSSWVNCGDPEIYRYYPLFHALGNVRGYAGGLTHISDSRGVPKDCSCIFDAYVSDYGTDGHSHSWVSLKELRDFDTELPEVEKWIEQIIEKMEKFGEDEDVRLVFFFDN